MKQNYSDTVRMRMQACGVRKQVFADAVGVSVRTVYNFLHGTSDVSVSTVEAFDKCALMFLRQNGG